jgi:transposase
MTTTIKHLDHARHHAGAMDDPAPPDPEVPERSLGRRQFSAKYKAKVLAEYDALPRSARGAMLRREGLYSSHLVTWRRERQAGMLKGLTPRTRGPKPTRSPQDEEIRQLREANRRLTEDLRKAEIVIDVQKKVAALLEGHKPSSGSKEPR